MNALNQMNNIEKGKLLARLFPNEIKSILNAMNSIYKMLIENKKEIVENWDNPLISSQRWYKLAELSNDIITKNNSKLISANRFANELFNGYIAFFTIDCIVKYAEEEKKDTKFWHLVQALFKFE